MKVKSKHGGRRIKERPSKELYVVRWLEKYENCTPQEIGQIEGRKAYAVISESRDLSKEEALRLKAAMWQADRFMPVKTQTELSGEVKLTGLEVKFVK